MVEVVWDVTVLVAELLVVKPELEDVLVKVVAVPDVLPVVEVVWDVLPVVEVSGMSVPDGACSRATCGKAGAGRCAGESCCCS